jgi:hypothetical protein
MQNEFQNAYATAQLIQRRENEFTFPADMFAVVAEFLDYCPFTDATLPNPGRRLVRLCGTRRVAEYYARKLDDEYGESWGAVYPKEEKKFTPVDYAPMMDDDIPF